MVEIEPNTRESSGDQLLSVCLLSTHLWNDQVCMISIVTLETFKANFLKKIVIRFLYKFQGLDCRYLPQHGRLIKIWKTGPTPLVWNLSWCPLCYHLWLLYATDWLKHFHEMWTFCSWVLTLSMPAVPKCCCLNGSAPYWSNPPFLIFDIRALWRSVVSTRVPECQKLTSSSAMPEGPRELDQRFQVGGSIWG